ncbi:MAG TPA: phage virion morphogenesis protein [Gemmatimonadaceae bacterium]|nr:phage virion morphogenesis protein [Gemmatimonadaceae bacterium]
MFRVRLVVENEIVIDRVLAGIEARARNVAPAWPAVVRAFQTIVRRAFDTEGGSTGAPWAPLAPRTQADRRRHGFPPAHPILERTGALARALTIGEGAYVSMQPTRMEYRLGAAVGYFTYHQSTRPRTRLPRRAPVLLTADDRTAMMHPIRLYITGRDVHAPRRAAWTGGAS